MTREMSCSKCCATCKHVYFLSDGYMSKCWLDILKEGHFIGVVRAPEYKCWEVCNEYTQGSKE
jgi:hypothetical protein